MASSDEYSSDSGPDVNAPLKRVYLKDIKGRWLHSNANIGLITVNPEESTAVLTDGTVWELEEKGGTILMDEYRVVPELSTLSELVWVYPTDHGTKKYRWFFEDDGDIELDFAPITKKRERIPCSDNSDQEKDDGSDDSDSDPDAIIAGNSDDDEEEPEADELTVPKLMTMFSEWVLSTNTQAHEKRLQRQGFLKKEFPIKLRGGGIKGILHRMSIYGITREHINHRNTGTMVILKEHSRNLFIKKHPEYKEHFFPPEGRATPEEGEGTREPSEKRRKLDGGPNSSEEVVQDVRDRLNDGGKGKEIYAALEDAEALNITPDLLRSTKIGLAVNGVVKKKDLPASVRDKARSLLEEWKTIFRAIKNNT